MRPKVIQTKLICHPELRNGIGAWASKGRWVAHKMVRKADVYPAVQLGHSNKKLTLVIAPSGSGPLSKVF